MSALAQAGGASSGRVSAFVVSVVAVFGIPVAVFLLGRVFERFF